ncbi:Dna2/Cas4 domain-containing protein [Methanimicrococcus sp. OttesenSCG-928-J09]|nr:Dna2/Cas4 domain-containing protein [Methanimicrococcus sp. OttesenSCG-928-J09]
MISVSEIKLWTACPRQFYYNYSAWKKGKTDLPAEERAELILKNDLLREVCLDLPEIVLESRIQTDAAKLDEEKLAERIKERLAETETEIQLQTEDLGLERYEKNKKSEEFISPETAEKMAENIIKTIQRSGFDLFEFADDPFAVEKVYYFQELKLYGAPPKVLEKEGELLPYLIKISKAPDNGVWEGERIAAAAYLMILEREFGRQFVSDSALIDYFGDYRLIQVRPLDRRKVFRAVRKIKDIKSGKMPREKNIRLCEKCVFQEKCQIKGKTIFTKLFGERAN